MTSDAKIGLLLGLVFIFIIAFIINGLPRFRSNTNNNELTTNMVSSQNDPLGIAANERKVEEVFNRAHRIKKERIEEVPAIPEDEGSVRFEMKLPQRPSEVKENLIVETSDDKVEPAAPPSKRDEKTRANRPKPVEPDSPKIYVVSNGDNLATIAQKFYGPEYGNKIISIMRIFEANRKFLTSPDEIVVGQKLTIPPLWAPGEDKGDGEGGFARTLFEKVKSIGRKRPSPEPAKASRSQRNRQYVVREGDSLWKISVAQLGDGKRYKEISELNADILEDEDDLPVGTHLKIPVR
jgi:nucleoid-associated protein YgaU